MLNVMMVLVLALLHDSCDFMSAFKYKSLYTKYKGFLLLY